MYRYLSDDSELSHAIGNFEERFNRFGLLSNRRLVNLELQVIMVEVLFDLGTVESYLKVKHCWLCYYLSTFIGRMRLTEHVLVRDG